MGPPAKWLLGIKLNRGFESLPPRLKEKNPHIMRVFDFNIGKVSAI